MNPALSKVSVKDVRDHVAASIRAELIILAYTPGVTAETIIGDGIRDAGLWVERGLEAVEGWPNAVAVEG